MYKANPEYAKACANNPIMQEFNRQSLDLSEEDFDKMSKMSAEMTVEQLQEMMTSEFRVVDEKKESMKTAKNLTNEAACWVCLDDGPDEDGNPLVRYCSCRGNSG